MSDTNFQPIFDYVVQSNQKLKEELKQEIGAEFRDEMSGVKIALANLSAQVKKYHKEMLVSGHRLERVESGQNWLEIK